MNGLQQRMASPQQQSSPPAIDLMSHNIGLSNPAVISNARQQSLAAGKENPVALNAFCVAPYMQMGTVKRAVDRPKLFARAADPRVG
jgi:hypothetical protein